MRLVRLITTTLLCLSLFSAFGHIHAQAQGDYGNARQYIDQLANYYESILGTDAIDIAYRIDNVPDFSIKTSEVYAYKWSEIRHIVNMNGQKCYTTYKHPVEYANQTPYPKKERVTTQVYSLDDQYFSSIDSISSTNLAGIRNIDTNAKNQINLNLYYFKFMGLVFFGDPEINQKHRRLYPQKSYWMPTALVEQRDQYVVRPNKETIDGIECLVLERPGLDTIWIQPKPVPLVIRRRYNWGMNEQIREVVTFSDYQEISGGLKLPRKIQFVKYAAPWDGAAVQGKVACVLNLQVINMKVVPTTDITFRANIPKGAEVHDYVSNKNGTVFYNQPDENPFDRVAGSVKSKNQIKLLVTISIFMLLALTSVWVYFRRKKYLASGTVMRSN